MGIVSAAGFLRVIDTLKRTVKIRTKTIIEKGTMERY